jgi:hypothetical protein
MKKLLLTAAAILATLNIYAQGNGVVGFSSAGTPADNRVYVTQDSTTPPMSGVAADNRYSIAFYWSEGGSPWTQIGANADFLAGAGAGQFLAGNRTITGLSANGAVVDILAKAWSKADGGSYDAVIAANRGYAGQSPIVNIKTKDPLNTLETVPSLVNDSEWVAWALTPVPEPSVIGLGLLGAGALLMLRRRK